ncbi:hypothetical protein D3C75_1023970 [compost metagenome]
MLARGNKLAAQREHFAEQLAFGTHQQMSAIALHRRIVIERRAFLAAGFPAIASVEKRTASGDAPVVV